MLEVIELYLAGYKTWYDAINEVYWNSPVYNQPSPGGEVKPNLDEEKS